MQVFLVRHGEASDGFERDAERPLTARGREQARALADRLRWHDCTPTHVWTSPLVRAVQTAELVTKVRIEIVPALAPIGSIADVVTAVHALPAGAAVMLVGHEPSLSAIGALLVGETQLVGLAKAEAVRIVDGVVRWRFAWDAEAATPPRPTVPRR